MENARDITTTVERAGAAVRARLASAAPADAGDFLRRFERYAPDACELLASLYGDAGDFDACLAAIFETAVDAYLRRPAELRALDRAREADPRWYQDHRMMGGVCYVDRFAGTLQGVREKIPYFKELGLTYLHLMPLFRTPEGPNDDGYAVSSYREVDPALGAMDDLRALAAELRAGGISLVLDFVFNHTADEHTWALRARQGDPFYQDFYFWFEDRTLPDAYDATLREIFPEEHRGSFTYREDIDRWVWTTFHAYQWDLNYHNPAVFRQMLDEMLFLANVGAEVLRLDAIAFIWKALGTTSENLPQAHTIVRAFNALVRIAAPAMIFKSEAIVHPDDVRSYFGSGRWAGRECEISYHPLLMVLLWESLATQHTHLLRESMRRRLAIPEACAWVNYVRSHDDIGWGFADEDAESLGIHPFYHRQYLNRFYTGEEEGSFSAGQPFQFNPRTLDMRISGTTASLAGLERALAAGDDRGLELAIRRILLVYGIALSMGGIPLLYLGDEVGMLNDYSSQAESDEPADSRLIHRPPLDWARVARRSQPGTIPYRIFQPLTRLIGLREGQPAFGAATRTDVLDPGNDHVFAFVKQAGGQRVLVIGNFTTREQPIDAGRLPFPAGAPTVRDRITGRTISTTEPLMMAPYEILWVNLSTAGATTWYTRGGKRPSD